MKKRIVSCIVTFMLLILMVPQAVFSDGGIIIKNEVSADSYIYGNASKANTNFGSKSSLQTDNTSSTKRYAFMRFNVTDDLLAGAKITLNVHIYNFGGSTGGDLLLYGLTGDDKVWDESTVTWENSGTISSATTNQIGSITGLTTDDFGTWKEVDITDYVKAQADKVAVILFASTAKIVTIHSKESNYKPYLQTELEITDSEKAEKAADSFDISQYVDISHVTENFVLPLAGEHGSTISWSSSNEEFVRIDAQGNAAVTRPAQDLEDAAVTLTATFTVGEATKQAFYTLCVVKLLGEGFTIVQTASADTYVYAASAKQDTNYGTDSKMQLDSSAKRIGFVRFNTTDLFRTGEEIYLYMYIASLINTNGGQLNVWGMQGEDRTSWIEGLGANDAGDGLTWKNSASYRDTSKMQLVGTVKVAGEDKKSNKYLDVTSFVKSQTDGIVCFMLECTSGGFGVATKEGNNPIALESHVVYTDETCVMLDEESLTLGDTSAVTGNIFLPTFGTYNTKISWESDNTDVIVADNDQGRVYRPAYTAEDVSVTLTATVSKNEASKQKSFTVTVLRQLTPQEDIDKIMSTVSENFILNKNASADYVISDLTLPSKLQGAALSYTISDPSLIEKDGEYGKVYIDRITDADYKLVTIVITGQKNGATASKAFTLKLIGTSTIELLGAADLSVSSYEDNNVGEKALDDRENTGWLARENDTEPWISFDFKKMISVNTVDVMAGGDGLDAFSIQYSNNGKYWSNAYNGGKLSDYASIRCTFDTVKARYLRLVITEKSGDLAGIREIDAYYVRTDENCVKDDLSGISLPTSTKEDLTLVTSGEMGSVITWESSNPDVITATGKVNRQKNDTEVTLTATAVKGSASASKSFKVTAAAQASSQGGSSGGSSSGGGGSYVGNQRSQNTVAGVPEAIPQTPSERVTRFSDLPDSHWASRFVEALADRKLLDGRDDGKFYPDDMITREEFIKIVMSAVGYDQAENPEFSDVSESAWYYPYVAAAKSMGIISGREDGSFGVGSSITRQEMAVMICRALEKTGKTLQADTASVSFKDADSISDYAQSSVKLLAQAGIISGHDDGTFMPHAGATRAQAAKIVSCLLDGEAAL